MSGLEGLEQDLLTKVFPSFSGRQVNQADRLIVSLAGACRLWNQRGLGSAISCSLTSDKAVSLQTSSYEMQTIIPSLGEGVA